MAKVITFSTRFQKQHPRAGEETFFVEKFVNSAKPIKSLNDIPNQLKGRVNDFFLMAGDLKKHHTIRAGNRFVEGDIFSPRIWSGKPYASKQIDLCEDLTIKKVWNIEINTDFEIWIDKKFYAHISSDDAEILANNDGLSLKDFKLWFNDLPYIGQIICWSDEVNY